MGVDIFEYLWIFVFILTLKLKSFGLLSLKRDESFWDLLDSTVIRGFAFWSCNVVCGFCSCWMVSSFLLVLNLGLCLLGEGDV